MSPVETAGRRVQEMQGLYGPFTIAERVVQKIWLRRDFDQRVLRLQDGRHLVIRSPGAWNLLAGPDFRDARLLIEGVPVAGDIEVHFHLADWRAHGHARDPGYANVVLHVVLFPPSNAEPPALRIDGREIPTLVLLPQLHRSLEEHASDDALENMTERDAAERIADLAAMTGSEASKLLLQHAWTRWEQKKRFAALRIQKLGWLDACHHTALEILGYRQNRPRMLTVATMHPIEEWSADLDPDRVFGEQEGQWHTQGVRPANHPRVRLRQYHRWTSGCLAWPDVLKQTLGGQALVSDASAETKMARRTNSLAALREKLASTVLGNAVGGSRLDTLVCDGFLPLVASAENLDLRGAWFHWFMGDVPMEVRKGLAILGIAGRGASPFCHGRAQGLMGWLAERERRASG